MSGLSLSKSCTDLTSKFAWKELQGTFVFWAVIALLLISIGSRSILHQVQLPHHPTHPSFTPARKVISESVPGIPDHVWRFNERNVSLPKYPSSEILLISFSGDQTTRRQMTQNYTFGRILEIEFITNSKSQICVFCSKDDECHITASAERCKELKEDDNPPSNAYCAAGSSLGAFLVPSTHLSTFIGLQFVLGDLGHEQLPKWVHLLDNQTWINPISELLLTRNLDPEEVYFLGDGVESILAGGPGQLLSRGALKKLLGPAATSELNLNFTNWNGTISIKSQLELCLVRVQTGEWCPSSEDWLIAKCLAEVGVQPTDLGGPDHQMLFSKLDGVPDRWLTLKEEVGQTVRRTHTMAMKLEEEEMFKIFYEVVVPYYEGVKLAFNDPFTH